MASTRPHPDVNKRNLHIAVYYKWAWTEPWRYAPYFEAISATLAAAPTISTATFKTHYGEGYWEDMQQMVGGNVLQSYAYCYIQIRIRRGGDETIIWTGVILAETFRLLGQSGTIKTADQIIQAQGLEILLQKRLDGAWVLPVGGGDSVWIDNIPTFNRQHEYGGNIIGNRSNSKFTYDGKEAYLFAANDKKWNNYDICENLSAFYSSPDSNQGETGPTFILSIEPNLKTALETIIGVYDFKSRTVLEALNMLINRSRGFAWYVRIAKNSEGNEDNADIVIFSLLDEDIQLGDYLMPANSQRIALDLWSEQMHTNVEVIGDITHVYDQIIVQGARMKSCCSLSFDNNGIERGWSTAEENAFKQAAMESEGYGELDDTKKEDRNDNFRAEDKFERVFTTFRILRNWTWKIDGKIVNPRLDSAGDLHTNEQATYWNVDKRFINSLPFKVGFDYSGPQPVDNNLANAEPEFRRLFVLVKDKNGKYQYADKFEHVTTAVRALTREMGVSMRFRPQYLAAKNHWDGSEPAKLTYKLYDIGIDYEDSIVTAFLETDQIVQIVHTFNYYENQRILIITIPDAELWYIVPDTIIGIDENGDCIKYGCSNLLRDDRGRLKAALAAARAWYGKERNKVSITIKSIDPGIPVGTLIENVDVAAVGAIGSVITSLRWDFQTRPAATMIMTDFGELDIAGIFRRNR